MEKFAVIDTETNFKDEVMSIGVVIAYAETFDICMLKYYILTPEHLVGGMFSYALKLQWDFDCDTLEYSRDQALSELKELLQKNKVSKIFAYNASFDYRHLPELHTYEWYDIMRLASYRQYNSKIPENADCFSTGKLKRNFRVECMKELLTGIGDEQHNALCDAVDELLCIMKPLGHKIEDYLPYFPQNKSQRKKLDIQSKLEFYSTNNSNITIAPTFKEIYLAVERLTIEFNNYLIMQRTPITQNIIQIKAGNYKNNRVCIQLQFVNTLTNESFILSKKLTIPETKIFLLNYKKGKKLNIRDFEKRN